MVGNDNLSNLYVVLICFNVDYFTKLWNCFAQEAHRRQARASDLIESETVGAEGPYLGRTDKGTNQRKIIETYGKIMGHHWTIGD